MKGIVSIDGIEPAAKNIYKGTNIWIDIITQYMIQLSNMSNSHRLGNICTTYTWSKLYQQQLYLFI